jgi:8-oxo-dGTP pyrophosphatase MutT (NUDIX family)
LRPNQGLLYPEADGIAHSTVMGAGSSAKVSQRSRLPKRRQQVAAVCYRIRKHGIEFLLVQTSGRRWIFPKGGVEPGLTHAQSAALEAFEEAGVHGRMEQIPFARYFRRKPDAAAATKTRRSSGARSSQPQLAVTAHLCEVTRLELPQESNRHPTWFSAAKAKQRLLEHRAAEFGTELARVVDRALSRIQRVHNEGNNHLQPSHRDELQKVRFEAFEDGRYHDLGATFARQFLRQHGDARSVAAIEVAVRAHFRKALRIGATAETRRPVLRLGAGTESPAETAHNITAIDSGRRPNRPKSSTMPRARTKPRANS